MDELDSSEQEREQIMKTLITLVIAAIVSATAANAEVITKGGYSGLHKAPAPNSVAAAAKPMAPMACGNCKSEFVTATAPAFKGTTPSTSTVERHACASCGNKWITSGHGKAKVDVAVHTCGGCKS
jgi:hypothetical protein